jgi:hypothetical protein
MEARCGRPEDHSSGESRAHARDSTIFIEGETSLAQVNRHRLASGIVRHEETTQ